MYHILRPYINEGKLLHETMWGVGNLALLLAGGY